MVDVARNIWQALEPGGIVSITIDCPGKTGLVVGKGGAAVANMQRESGVKVGRCSLKPIETRVET